MVSCRSLPYQALLAELAQTTGQQVMQGNVRYALTQAFGPDASLKAQAYLGVCLYLSCLVVPRLLSFPCVFCLLSCS